MTGQGARDDEREALIERMRRASTAIYVATEEAVADDIAAMLRAAADLLARNHPEPAHRDERDAVAVAIAKAADADYWTDEIREWEDSEEWEREAHPDNYPHDAYEDRENFREQADAAIAVLARKHPEPEWEYGASVHLVEGGVDIEMHTLPWGDREQAEQIVSDGNAEQGTGEPLVIRYVLVKRTAAVPAGEWVPVGEGEQE